MGAMNTVKRWLGVEDQAQLEWILQEAGKHKVSDYDKQILRRYDYLNADMEADGLDLLKKEFVKSWADMDYKMVEFPLLQFITRKRARSFRGDGARFYLKGKDGKEIDPKSKDAEMLKILLEKAAISNTLYEVDEIEDICNGVAAFIWWDLDHVEVSPYTGDVCHMALNDDRPWDPYSSRAVAFEQEGWDGVRGEAKFVIYGARDLDRPDKYDQEGRPIFHPTVHYISSKSDSRHVNDGDVNPYKHRHTNDPMYPFTWFQSKRGDVYWKGGDDLVRFNRILNLVLTYLVHNSIWQMSASPMFETPQGGLSPEDRKKLRSVIFSAPNKALDIPPGVKFSFVRPDVQLAPFTNLIEMMTQYEAMMHQLSPKSLDIAGGLPQSGIALQIEMMNLVEYIEDRQILLKPHAIDLIDKMISIWNLRAPHAKKGYRAISDGLMVDWDPGDTSTSPKNTQETIDTHRAGMDLGTYDPDDLYMNIHKVDKATATEQVNAKLQRTAEVLAMSTRYPEEPDDAQQAADQVPVEGEEEKPKPDASGEGVEDAESKDLVSNIYQLLKAVDAGIMSRAEARVLLFPDESEEEAEKKIQEAIEFNAAHAPVVEGEGGTAKGVPTGGATDTEPTPEQKKVEEELQSFIKDTEVE